MNIQIIDPTTYPGWDDLLLETPDCTFFHTSAWARTLRDSYQYTPVYFTLFHAGKFAALIPFMDINSALTGHRGVSLPFTDHCDPILGTDIDFPDIFESIVAYGKRWGWKHLELRTAFSCALSKIIPDACSPCWRYYGHTLDLSSNEDSVFEKFRDSTKRNIKKAVSEGVEVKNLTSFAAVKEFYRLNCITRREHGLPPQPFRFFEKIYEHVLSKNLGFITLAHYRQKVVAGNVYFCFGKQAIYKYGASDRQYQYLRANNLVMWEAIKRHCQDGFGTLSFGRTDLDHSGLRQFKTGWGAKEEMITYYRFDLARSEFISQGNSMAQSYQRFLKKLPIPLLKILGTVLYGHMG